MTDFPIIQLQATVAAVCPIEGVSVGDPYDKTTWRVDVDPTATDDQKAAARSALLAFSWGAVEEERLAQLNQIQTIYSAKLTGGFPWNFGTADAPNLQHLQVADDSSKINWLTLKTIADDAVAAGQGATVVPIRTMSGKTIPQSCTQVEAMLSAMRMWGLALSANTWTLTDALEKAADPNAVDLTVGWP